MSHVKIASRNALSASHVLADTDPQSEAVERVVKNLQDQVGLLNELARADKNSPWGADSMKDDVAAIGEQIKRLRAAAAYPASNYRRILAITDQLRDVWTAASKPQNAAVRPRVARLVQQVAGVFAEVDTVKDLDKPLEQIEKAIHGLYGDQSKNDTWYFGRRGKGHHEKPDTE
jgi:hypothetical protein